MMDVLFLVALVSALAALDMLGLCLFVARRSSDRLLWRVVLIVSTLIAVLCAVIDRVAS